MEKQDIKDLLLGKAVRYFENKDFKFWKLLNKIEYIVNNNIQYESFDLEEMEKKLYDYCKKVKYGS